MLNVDDIHWNLAGQIMFVKCCLNEIEYIEFKIDDVELMQFTGCKDKNRKEIFEGDILETELDKDIFVVDYNKGSFFLKNKACTTFFVPELFNMEVIGNIYKNKHLPKRLDTSDINALLDQINTLLTL